MDISFVILNYRSENYLKHCIQTIQAKILEETAEIIVVNNDTLPLSESFATNNLRILNQETNLGFAKACNLGAKAASGKILFFLNPDTEIKTFDFKILSEALTDNAVGIVAPKLLTESGDVQAWSFGSKITPLKIIWENLLHHTKNPVLLNKPLSVDWVSGAAFAIRRNFFAQMKGFDENFFMYFEDVDLCKRIRTAGKKILLLPNLTVTHFGGKSSHNKRQQKLDYYTSQDYYLFKHFGKSWSLSIKILRTIALFADNLVQSRK